MMLIKEPKERLTVDDALKHPFFAMYGIQPTTSNITTHKYVKVEDAGIPAFTHTVSYGSESNASYA